MCKVCVCMYQILASFSCYAKECVNIMKVYIERNKMQVELIRFRKNIDSIHVYVCESRNPMFTAYSLDGSMHRLTPLKVNILLFTYTDVE